MDGRVNGFDRALAANIGARVLAGGGDMALVPFRAPEGCPVEVLTHGLDANGNLVVTCRDADLATYLPTEVRVDVMVQSPQFQVAIYAASVHALATVEWFHLNGDTVTGSLELGKLHVHHMGAPATFAVEVLRPLALGIGEVDYDRLSAYDTVSGLGTPFLELLFDAAVGGRIPHLLGEVMPLRGCAHTKNQLFIVDVCGAGVTLLRTNDSTHRTVHIALPRPARDLEDLASQLTGLAVEASGWHAESRI